MKNIGEILEEIFENNKTQDYFFLAQITNIWQENFPKSLTQHAKVVKIIEENMILVLGIDSAVWKHEILIRQKEILEKINSILRKKTNKKNHRQILKIEIQ